MASRSLCLLATALAATSAASAQDIDVVDANVTYRMFRPGAAQSDSPTANFTADAAADPNIAHEHGFYYRLAGDAAPIALKDDGTLTIVNSGAHSDADWADVDNRGRISIELDVDAMSTGATSGLVVFRMTIRNLVFGQQTVDLYTYADLDVCGSDGNSASGNNRQTVTNTCASAEFYGSSGARWQVGPFDANELGLADGTNTLLSNSGTPFSGDYAGALQWTQLVLMPGDYTTVTCTLAMNDSSSAASSTTAGYGCTGSASIPIRNQNDALPILGTTVVAQCPGLPVRDTDTACLFLGDGTLDLTPFGGTFLGSDCLVNPISQLCRTIPAGVRVLPPWGASLPIPALVSLNGAEVYLQFLNISGRTGAISVSQVEIWTLGSY